MGPNLHHGGRAQAPYARAQKLFAPIMLQEKKLEAPGRSAQSRRPVIFR
jgi:hypothetical protein